jgi:rhomboid protease GluP
VLAFLVFLLTVGAIAYRVMTPEQRINTLRAIVVTARQMKDYGRRELEPFRRALRARTPRIIVTPALIALNIAIAVCALFTKSGGSDSAAFIPWGANFGPLTSNGQWWRLVSAIFIQRGLLALVVNMVVLAQLGSILERLVGRLAFSSVLLTAGVFANLVTLSTHPTTVSAGASGAVYGIIGQLAVSLVTGWLRPSEIAIPLAALKRCAPAIGAFALYSALDQSLGTSAQFAG